MRAARPHPLPRKTPPLGTNPAKNLRCISASQNHTFATPRNSLHSAIARDRGLDIDAEIQCDTAMAAGSSYTAPERALRPRAGARQGYRRRPVEVGRVMPAGGLSTGCQK